MIDHKDDSEDLWSKTYFCSIEMLLWLWGLLYIFHYNYCYNNDYYYCCYFHYSYCSDSIIMLTIAIATIFITTKNIEIKSNLCDHDDKFPALEEKKSRSIKNIIFVKALYTWHMC